MNAMMQAWALPAAALAAAAMGFSIQRGATCTVAAVAEIVEERRATRLLAMAEAALWVAVGVWSAQRLGWLGQAPPGYALGAWTLAGAALLGLGAFVNRACVFGAIARLGSGEWAYLATPLGFFLGCWSVDALFAPGAAQPLALGSVLPDAPQWLVALVALALAWRAVVLFRAGRAPEQQLVGWSPHSATVLIGATFLVTLLLAGAWAYTDLLADLARGMAQNVWARALLALALLLGAMLGGWSAGLLRMQRPSAPALLRCLAGGLLMGWGSLLLPGSNDGLILLGMPLLWPYAWAAFATMGLTIGAAKLLQGGRRRAGAASARASKAANL